MSSLRFVGFGAVAGAVSLGACWGCGGSKPAAEVAAPPATTATGEAPLASLTPVAAPAELFAIARVANAEKAADTAIAWSGLPMNWRSLLEKELPDLPRLVALSAPVDFAASIDPASLEAPHFFWAVSVGVSSVDGAVGFLRQKGLEVTPAGAGAYLATDKTDVACLVSRALGAAPARIVCSDTAPSVEALAPYMTRGMPNESFGTADVHAHVVAEPFRRRYSAQFGLVRTVGVPFLLRELAVDHPKLDRALHDVLYGLADEVIALAADADRLDFDVGVAPSNDVLDVSVSLALNGQKAWWSRAVAKAATQMTVAPDMFWKLPAASTSASFSAYRDPEAMKGVVESLRDLLDGFLDYQKLSEARRRPLVDSFAKFLQSGTKAVRGTLPLPEPAAGAKPDPALDMARAAIGQHLMITDKPGADAIPFLSELVKSIGDKGLRDHLAKTQHVSAALLPTAKERAYTAKTLPAGGKRFDFIVPGALFDTDGSFSLDAAGGTASKKPQKAKAPLTVIILAVPDGDVTWYAFGTDEKALTAAIVEARAGTGKTLATREGLASFRTEPVISGGFTSLVAVLAGLDRRLGRHHGQGAQYAFDKLPHLGATPITVTLTSEVKGQGSKVSFKSHVPKAVIEDSVGLAATEVAGGLGH